MEEIHRYNHSKFGHSYVQLTNNEEETMYLKLMSDNKFGYRIQHLFLTEEDLHQVKFCIEKYFDKKH
jgi:hypothetical protein